MLPFREVLYRSAGSEGLGGTKIDDFCLRRVFSPFGHGVTDCSCLAVGAKCLHYVKPRLISSSSFLQQVSVAVPLRAVVRLELPHDVVFLLEPGLYNFIFSAMSTSILWTT